MMLSPESILSPHQSGPVHTVGEVPWGCPLPLWLLLLSLFCLLAALGFGTQACHSLSSLTPGSTPFAGHSLTSKFVCASQRWLHSTWK